MSLCSQEEVACSAAFEPDVILSLNATRLKGCSASVWICIGYTLLISLVCVRAFLFGYSIPTPRSSHNFTAWSSCQPVYNLILGTIGPPSIESLEAKNECLQGHSRLSTIRWWSRRKFERTFEFSKWYISAPVFLFWCYLPITRQQFIFRRFNVS